MSQDIDERDYFCSNCGKWLGASTIPLGTQGGFRVTCSERACGRTQTLRLGVPPRRRVDRAAWIDRVRQERHARRQQPVVATA